MGTDAVGRYDIFLEVFILIVAPDHDEVRTESVECRAHLAQLRHQSLAMDDGGGRAFIGAPFGTHRRRPALGVSILLRQARILQHPFQDVGHPIVGSGQRWIVRYPDRQGFCHLSFLHTSLISLDCCNAGSQSRVALSTERYRMMLTLPWSLRSSESRTARLRRMRNPKGPPTTRS